MAREKERFAAGVPQTDPLEAAKWNTYKIIIADADALRDPADIRVAGFSISLRERSALNRFGNFSAVPKLSRAQKISVTIFYALGAVKRRVPGLPRSPVNPEKTSPLPPLLRNTDASCGTQRHRNYTYLHIRKRAGEARYVLHRGYRRGVNHSGQMGVLSGTRVRYPGHRDAFSRFPRSNNMKLEAPGEG